MNIHQLPDLAILKIIRYLPINKLIEFYKTDLQIYIKEYLKENTRLDELQILQRTKLSKQFIRDFKHKINWHAISQHKILSEPFIREF